jgi:hypothetical protein
LAERELPWQLEVLGPETSPRKRHIARHVRTNVLQDPQPPKRQRLNLL